jgi:dihydropteroate synthase
MLQLGTLTLETPAVMGVLNVTPDSFSDGGRYAAAEAAIRHALRMADDGAAIVDIGGESTRPGAEPVAEAEELDRVIPIIEAVRRESDVPISIDSSKPAVMRAAVAAGADMINDVYALRANGALDAAVELRKPVCLMHMRGEPRTMQDAPDYVDVVREVAKFLEERVQACADAGLGRDLLVIDPGFGFGKTRDHNVQLLANLRKLAGIGPPVLIGVSRKATLGAITGRDVGGRLAAGLAAAVLAVGAGASIVRTHDVAETVDALRIATIVMEQERKDD